MSPAQSCSRLSRLRPTARPTARSAASPGFGINYTVDASKAYDANDTTYPGSTYYGPKTINRVTIDSINGQAFDAKATYAVITNNFLQPAAIPTMAFASASAQFDTGIPLDEALDGLHHHRAQRASSASSTRLRRAASATPSRSPT